MANRCERCGLTPSPVHMRKGENSSGEETEIFVCNDCYSVSKSMGWLRTESGEIIKINDSESAAPQMPILPQPTVKSTNWTAFLETISMIVAFALTIVGALIGRSVADAVSYHNSDIVFGMFVGGAIGLVVGLLSIAMNMVICEISTTLKDILRELRRK